MKRTISLLPIFSLFIFCVLVSASYAGYVKPQLGTYLGELDNTLRDRMGYQGQGVLVNGIVKGSGAEKSGLARDDIILEFNNQKMSCVQDLVNAVRQTSPGDRIQVKFFRKGEIKAIPVEITEKKDWVEFAPPHKWIHFNNDRPYLGIRMQELNPQLAEYFKTQSGILIMEVIADGPGHKADLRAGDVIVAWQDNEVKNLRDFYSYLNNAKEGDKIRLTVVSHGEKLEKEVILGEIKQQETYGFHINRDDSGDLVFRMGNKEYPAHFDIPLPEIDLDLKGLKDSVKSLKEGIGTYREDMKQLRDEVYKLKQEIESLKKQNHIQ